MGTDVTTPTPFNNTNDPNELRKRWLNRFFKVQSKYDAQLRKILIGAAEDAQERVSALSTKTTFSSGVQTAQLRLVMQEVREVVHNLFGEVIPIVKDGQKSAAVAAVSAFTETDKEYLRQALSQYGGNVDDFIEAQKKQSQIQIVNVISRITKSDIPLSRRVYRSERLATGWVQHKVNLAIVRGASAREIAKDVRSSINPNVPGGVSYAAMRLGRTELNNAFHATSISLAQDRPWVDGMKWNLSKTHDFQTNKCLCETYSNRIFDIDRVPVKPHPQCRCFVTPEVEPLDTFVRHLNSGRYRDWIENAA